LYFICPKCGRRTWSVYLLGSVKCRKALTQTDLNELERILVDGVNFIAHEIHNNHVILITTVMTKGEVLESTLDNRGLLLWDSFFKRKNVQEVVADSRIMQLTHDIRDYYQKRKIADGLPTLTLPDATHLAKRWTPLVGRFWG